MAATIKDIEHTIHLILDYIEKVNDEQEALNKLLNSVSTKTRDYIKSVNKFVLDHEERLSNIEQHLQSGYVNKFKVQTEH